MLVRCATRVTTWRRVLGDRRLSSERQVRLSPWIRALRGVSGVYILRDEDHLYIGQAVSLYDRIRRHFSHHDHGTYYFKPSATEARVYLLPRHILDAAEERLFLLHPHAVNHDCSSGVPF